MKVAQRGSYAVLEVKIIILGTSWFLKDTVYLSSKVRFYVEVYGVNLKLNLSQLNDNVKPEFLKFNIIWIYIDTSLFKVSI